MKWLFLTVLCLIGLYFFLQEEENTQFPFYYNDLTLEEIKSLDSRFENDTLMLMNEYGTGQLPDGSYLVAQEPLFFPSLYQLTYYYSDYLKEEGHFTIRNNYPNCKEGLWISYYDTISVIRSKGNYHNDNKIGIWTYYDKEGEVQSTFNFSKWENLTSGTIKENTPDEYGNLNTPIHFNISLTKETYNLKLKTGIITEFRNGKIYKTVHFHQIENPIGAFILNKDDQIFLNTGDYIDYFENGKINTKNTKIKDDTHEQIDYDTNGKLVRKRINKYPL